MAEQVNAPAQQQQPAAASAGPPLANPHGQQVFPRRLAADFPNLSPAEAAHAAALSDQVDIFTGERRPGAEVDMFGGR